MAESGERLRAPLEHQVAWPDRRVHQHHPRPRAPKATALGPDQLAVESRAVLVKVGGRLTPVRVTAGKTRVDVLVCAPRIHDGGGPGTVPGDTRGFDCAIAAPRGQHRRAVADAPPA